MKVVKNLNLFSKFKYKYDKNALCMKNSYYLTTTFNKYFSNKNLFNISGFSSKSDLKNKTDLTLEYYSDLLDKEVNFFFNSINNTKPKNDADICISYENFPKKSNSNSISKFNQYNDYDYYLRNIKILRLVRFLDNMSNDLCILIDTATALLSTLDETSTGLYELKLECYESIIKISNFMNMLNSDVKLYNCICLSLISSNLSLFSNSDVTNLLGLMSKEIGSIMIEKSRYEKLKNRLKSKNDKYAINNDNNSEEDFTKNMNFISKMISSDTYTYTNPDTSIDKIDSLILGEEEIRILNLLKSCKLLNSHLIKSFEFLEEDLKTDDILVELEITSEEINSLNSMGLKSMLSIHLEKFRSNLKDEFKTKNKTNNLALMDINILTTIICKSNSLSLKKKAEEKIKEICYNEHDNKLKTLLELVKIRCAKSYIISNEHERKNASYMSTIHGKDGFNKEIYKILMNLLIRLQSNYYEEIKEMIFELSKSISYQDDNNCNNTSIVQDKYLNKLLISENLSFSELKYLQTRFLELKYLNYINSNTISKDASESKESSNNIIEKDYITVGNLLNGFKILCKELFKIDLEFVMDDVLLEGEVLIHPSVLKCNIRKSDIIYSISETNSEKPKIIETMNINALIERIKSLDSRDEDFKDLLNLYKRDVEGVLYFDLFVRDGKERQIFSHMTLVGSKLFGKYIQQPKSLISTNIEILNRDLLNMSLSISNCKELLHEFGHAMHSIMSKTDFQSISGTRIPLQFAEIPSHFFEKFIFDYNFCKKWMIERHSNKSINLELFNTLIYGYGENDSLEINSLFDTIYNSLVDLNLHSFKFSELETISEDAVIKILKRNSYYPTINVKKLSQETTIIMNKEKLKLNKLKAFTLFHEELNGIRPVEILNYNDILDISNNLNTMKYNDSSIDFELLYVFSPHLKDYPCLYYSYVIGKVYSLLIWENLKQRNLSLNEIGEKLNKEFLSRGNNTDITQLIKQIIN